MSSVKSLPEAVRSSVRSGIILFDIARVVEELVFNSLDARASKVSVFVGIGTCYVKVSDDGTGITRDGLDLVGERYATSKFDHLADTDTRAGTFGFRGEALASISDVSLLEIVTKAFGRPNGYRKVTKGSKCLYLGICDGLRDVGTTVSVRDLFYNQPVRRKYIQSSPKKVLQSIKKCVLRIALVYSKISFKVVDIESDEILLCTQASSPTLLLTSCFGIDVSTSLHKLDIDNGTLKLFGYISGPCDNLPIKAFQYAYINSRFVCKGPIHKLVNQLAATVECNEQGKAVKGTQNRKRSRPQTCPAFILNISCPRSFYDLTYEPSKTYVEFKDWVPVLAFLAEAIQHLWNESISYDVLGDTVEFATDIMEKEEMLYGFENAISAEDVGVENIPGSFIIGKMKCSILSRQASPDPICSDLKILTEKDSYWSLRKHAVTPIKLSHEYSSYFKNERDKELGFVSQTNQLGDCPFSESMPEVSRNCEYKMHISDNKFFSAKDYFSVNDANCGEWCRENENNNNFSLGWEKDFVEGSPSNRSGSASAALMHDCQQSSDVEMFGGLKEPFLKSCSLQGILPQASSLLIGGAADFQIDDDFKIKEILTSSYDGFNISETKIRNRSFDCLTRTLWQDHESSFELLPIVDRKYCSAAELERLPRAFGESIPFYEEQFHGNDGFSFGSVPMRRYRGNGHLESDSDWLSLTADSYTRSTLWDEEHYRDINILQGRRNSMKHLMDNEENDCRYGHATLGKRFGRQNCATSCSNSGLEDSGSGCSHQRHGLNQNFSPNRSDIFGEGTDWLGFDSHHKNCKSRGLYQSQRCRNNWGRGNIFHFSKERIRSHSAPPFYRSKRKFFSLNCCLTAEQDKDPACPEVRKHLKSIALANSSLDKRQDLKKMRELKEAESNATKDVHSVCLIQDAPPLKETVMKEVQEPPNCGTKWRNYCSTTSSNNKSHNVQDQDNILDISSGFLHLASDSLVPESISKTCLEDATVLQQVDKKYIPIVAGRILAVVDQHAADERIRLEELRQKVLTGEAKTITFLQEEQELTLPEIGHQLLHNYSEEIKAWGWICNIHSRDSRSFKRSLNILHRQPTAITLKAVPCILGVNLSDVDLMEFLQQLADTDGSSMIPPSVLRILNSKACRGAIMFGDSLLPSECSLLISELKQTSLCFQCAHGRPTTAPLVNLEALHKQIANMTSANKGLNNVSWHGLRRHELSLERAQQRLRT